MRLFSVVPRLAAIAVCLSSCSVAGGGGGGGFYDPDGGPPVLDPSCRSDSGMLFSDPNIISCDPTDAGGPVPACPPCVMNYKNAKEAWDKAHPDVGVDAGSTDGPSDFEKAFPDAMWPTTSIPDAGAHKG